MSDVSFNIRWDELLSIEEESLNDGLNRHFRLQFLNETFSERTEPEEKSQNSMSLDSSSDFTMPKRKSDPPGRKQKSPAQKKATVVKQKYKCGYTTSPTRGQRVRKALYAVEKEKVSIRSAAKQCNISYGYLHRRLSGQVDLHNRNGPQPVFTKEEENAMAKWLSEMAERGMGLKPGEFLDFVQDIVKKEKRATPFKDDRPGYEWYYNFIARNSSTVEPRTETPLEMCRAKLNREQLDKWYSNFRNFLTSRNLIDKPKRIWNADETGFSMGSKATNIVIGPARKEKSYQVPHISGGHSKQRLTVMYCACADGSIMPPFFVYPQPAPKGTNPLSGAADGSAIAYTKKGWMDAVTFQKFIGHFDKYAGNERPVVLLIDSVSSHVHMSIFEDAKAKGIEIYRIVPNATHLMQPLDKGVFGPLKMKWHQVVRKHTREHPELPIGKANFAEKLNEAFYQFYKPLTVINSFRSSGIYPVDATVITDEHLKPGITFLDNPATPEEKKSQTGQTVDNSENAQGALTAFRSVLPTPKRETYEKRLKEGYDIEGLSPCYDTYKKLYMKTSCSGKVARPSHDMELENLEMLADDRPSHDMELENLEMLPDDRPSHAMQLANLELLANACINQTAPVTCSLSGSSVNCLQPPVKSVSNISPSQPAVSNISPSQPPVKSVSNISPSQPPVKSVSNISPSLAESLVFPHVKKSTKGKRITLLSTLPDNLTSGTSLRTLAMKELEKVRLFARKEKRAKDKYLAANRKNIDRNPPLKKKKNNMSTVSKRKGSIKKRSNVLPSTSTNISPRVSDDVDRSVESDVKCLGCHMSWEEDQAVGEGNIWVECDTCHGWVHADCCNYKHIDGEDFKCADCADMG